MDKGRGNSMSIQNSEQQTETTKELSNILIKAGEWKRAKTVAELIQSNEDRLVVLCELQMH